MALARSQSPGAPDDFHAILKLGGVERRLQVRTRSARCSMMPFEAGWVVSNVRQDACPVPERHEARSTSGTGARQACPKRDLIDEMGAALYLVEMSQTGPNHPTFL